MQQSKVKKNSSGEKKERKGKKISSGSKTAHMNPAPIVLNDNNIMGEIFNIIKTVEDPQDTSDTKDTLVNANSIMKSYLESKKFLSDNKIKISTITLDCKLHTLVYIDKFAKHVVLKENGIVSVKYGYRKNPATNRTIVLIKKKHSNKNFYNQVTILMKPMNNPIKNYINIKVFNNGSIQITGCSDMDDFNNVMTTLVRILKKGEKLKKGDETVKRIGFVSDPKHIGIYDIKIRMINSNFQLDYKIDRLKLAFLLKKYHGTRTTDTEIGYVEFKHKPNGGHSCVNIKYRYNETNKPSIFVFQTGAIIITGAKNLYQIIHAYHYIKLILKRYMAEVKIVELNPVLVNKEIQLYCRERKLLTKIQFGAVPLPKKLRSKPVEPRAKAKPKVKPKPKPKPKLLVI